MMKIPYKRTYSLWRPAKKDYWFSHAYTVERWNGKENKVETYGNMTYGTYAGAQSAADALNQGRKEA